MKRNMFKRNKTNEKNMSEYEYLRAEIISFEGQQRNTWIYMFVLFTTLFAFGLEISHQLFLVTYIILIPFQSAINRHSWSITKLSLYIRVFYEEDDCQINWESLHKFPQYSEFYKKFNKQITNVIYHTCSVQLGFLSMIFYIGNTLCDKYLNGKILLTPIDVSLIILAFVLFFIVILINKEYGKHSTELENAIYEYKKSI